MSGKQAENGKKRAPAARLSRAERLALELRANLQKRKAQQRARREPATSSSDDAGQTKNEEID